MRIATSSSSWKRSRASYFLTHSSLVCTLSILLAMANEEDTHTSSHAVGVDALSQSTNLKNIQVGASHIMGEVARMWHPSCSAGCEGQAMKASVLHTVRLTATAAAAFMSVHLLSMLLSQSMQSFLRLRRNIRHSLFWSVAYAQPHSQSRLELWGTSIGQSIFAWIRTSKRILSLSG